MDNKNTLQKIFLFGFFSLFFIVIIAMLKPYSTVFLWTALLYVLIKPLYRKAHRKLDPNKKFYNIKNYLLAGGFAIGTLILIIGPISIISVMLVNQAISLLQDLEKFIIANPNFLEDSDVIKSIFLFSEVLNSFNNVFENIKHLIFSLL